MAKYIKMFDTNSQYESYITGASANLPNASYISDEGISRLKSDKIPMIVMSIEMSDVKVGETAVVSVMVNEDAEGQVELLIKDLNASLVYSEVSGVSDGKAVFNVPGTAFPGAGVYWAKARYFGDTKYLTNRTAGTFEVSRNETNMSIQYEITDYSILSFEIVMPVDIEGSVYATLDGVAEDWSGEGRPGIIGITDGQGSISGIELETGSHTLVVSFSGNTKYEPVTDSETITIQDQREEMLLGVEVGDAFVGDNVDVSIMFSEGAEGYMSIQIVNSQTSATVFSDTATLTGTEDGKVTFAWENAGPAGDYDVYVEYSGDSNYKPASSDASFNVS